MVIDNEKLEMQKSILKNEIGKVEENIEKLNKQMECCHLTPEMKREIDKNIMKTKWILKSYKIITNEQDISDKNTSKVLSTHLKCQSKENETSFHMKIKVHTSYDVNYF